MVAPTWGYEAENNADPNGNNARRAGDAGDNFTQRKYQNNTKSGKVRHLMSGDTATIERLSICLPRLLKAFALKIGQDSSSGGYHEVTYFIHKRRK
jgi:hypothetical protein